MIHIDLPDGRWLELRPVLPDDELEAIAHMPAEEILTLTGLIRVARAIERFCEKRSSGLDDLTTMSAPLPVRCARGMGHPFLAADLHPTHFHWSHSLTWHE